jgi:hypothetical protein
MRTSLTRHRLLHLDQLQGSCTGAELCHHAKERWPRRLNDGPLKFRARRLKDHPPGGPKGALGYCSRAHYSTAVLFTPPRYSNALGDPCPYLDRPLSIFQT